MTVKPQPPDPSLDSLGRQTLVIDVKSDFDLICVFKGKLGWQEKQFSARKNRVLIGNNPFEAQINILDGDADSIHAVAQRVGDRWLIMETAKKDLMAVNGLPRRQAMVGRREKALVTIGESVLLFMAGAVDGAPPLLPEGPQATIRLAGQPFACLLEKPFLIGSHAACDFRTDRLLANDAKAASDEAAKAMLAAPFAAVLCSHGDRLFIAPLGGIEVAVDGHVLGGTAPLPATATLSLGGLSLAFELAEPLHGASLDDPVPDLRENRFCLLQLDGQGAIAGRVALRPQGHSMIIGRSSQTADLVVPVDEVSRKHAQMILYEKNILLEDCYSSNGTFVNDEMVGRSRVRAGDVLRFGGDLQFLLCYAWPEDLAGGASAG
jgi:hypothetical protein